MICVPLHIDYDFHCIDVTLIIMYMLWDVYRMLAERQAVMPL